MRCEFWGSHADAWKRENGVALITVLLVVAIATLTAVAMMTRQQLDIYRTANLLNTEQAYLYALGGESWAKRILWHDGKETQVDNLTEIWATPLPPLPILGGTLQGSLEDLQGRFNLNNLVTEGKVSPEDVVRLERLLTALELSPGLAQVMVDWIDADLEPLIPNGAEDNAYLIRTPAYRTSNTLFNSPSEILLLAGMDQASYEKLSPYICTLPTRTLINVNTAPPLVLRVLASELSVEQTQKLVIERDKKPFQTVQDFLVLEALAGLQVEAKSITVTSDYFLLTVQVEIDRATAQLKSVLYRSPEKVTVVMRGRGEL